MVNENMPKMELITYAKENLQLTISPKKNKDEILQIIKEKEIDKKQNEIALTATPVKRKPKGSRLMPQATQLRRGNLITANPQDKFKQHITEEEEKRRELISSADKASKKLLRGKLFGHRIVELDDKKYVIILATWEGETIMFRDYEFFPDLEPDHNLPIVEILSRIGKRTGFEFDFIITQMDPEYPDSKNLLGSRVKAMEKKKKKYWNATSKGKYDSKGNPVMFLRPGQIVEATIVSTIYQGIFVEVFGVETFIPNAELYRVMATGTRKKFKINQTILVMIQSIKREGNNIQFRASRKVLLKDRTSEIFDQFQVGDHLDGTVVRVIYDENRGIKVFVSVADQINIMCKMGNNVTEIPAEGDRVSITIGAKDRETKRLWGKVTHTYQI